MISNCLVILMTPDEAGNMFGYLAAAAGIAGFSLILFILASNKSESLADKLAELRQTSSRHAIMLAGFVALFAMMGSLYLSEIAHFIPCKLCWYQRIIMYPMAFLLIFAGIRGDYWIKAYGLAFSGFGMFVSAYHYQLQLNPEQHSPFCSAFESCTVQWLNVFGFMSIPFMAGMGFLFIFALLLFSQTPQDLSNDSEE